MKRRIVLILIIAGVLLLTGGGVWWYVRVNTGWRILAKAQMAIKANQFDNAIDLSADYVHRFPQDWQGYYWQAQGYLRQGKYPESRQCLDKILNSATPIPHDPLAVRILMADTYGDEANRFLSSPEAYRKPIGVDAALSQLEQALAQLEAVSPFEIKGQIDLAQAQAGHLMGVSQAHDIMAWIDQDARKTAGNTTVPSTAEGPSFAPAPAIDNRKMALGSLQKAVDKVVWVLSKDPSRGVCAQRAVEMCVRQQHVAGLEQLRTAVFALGDPPPAVAALLIAQEVQAPVTNSRPQRRRPASWTRSSNAIRRM